MPESTLKDHLSRPSSASSETFGTDAAPDQLRSHSPNQVLSLSMSEGEQESIDAAILVFSLPVLIPTSHANMQASNLNSNGNSIYINKYRRHCTSEHHLPNHQHEPDDQQNGLMQTDGSVHIQLRSKELQEPQQERGDSRGYKAPSAIVDVAPLLIQSEHHPASTTWMPAGFVALAPVAAPTITGSLELVARAPTQGFFTPDMVTDMQEQDTRRHLPQEHNLTLAPVMHQRPHFLRPVNCNIHSSNRDDGGKRVNRANRSSINSQADANASRTRDGSDDSNPPVRLASTCTNHTDASVDQSSSLRIAFEQALLIVPSSNGDSSDLAEEHLSRPRADRSICGNDDYIGNALATRVDTIKPIQVADNLTPFRVTSSHQHNMNSNNTVVLSKQHTRDHPHNDGNSNSGESIPCQRSKIHMPEEAVRCLEASYEYGIYLCRSSASRMSDAIIADAQHMYTVYTTTSTLRQETPRHAHPNYPSLGQTPLSDIEQADSTFSVSMIPSSATPRIRPIDSATSSDPMPLPPTKSGSRVCSPNLAREIVCKEISVGVHSFNKKGEDHRGQCLEYVEAGRPKKRRHWKTAQQLISDPIMARCRRVALGTEEEGADHMTGTDILARSLRLKAMQTPEIHDEGNSGDVDPSALLPSSEDFRDWAVQADCHRNLPDAVSDNDTDHGYHQYSHQDADGHPGSQEQQQRQEPQQQQQNDQHQYSVDGYNYIQPHHSHHNHAMSQEPSGTAPMDRTPPALPAVPLPNEPIPHQIRRVQSAYISSLHMQWEQQQQQQAQQQQQHNPYPGSVPMSRHRTVPLAPTDGPMVRLGGVPMSRTTFDPLTMEQRLGVAQRQVSWEGSMTPHDGESSSLTLLQHSTSTVHGAGAMTESGQGQNGHYFQTNHGGSAPRLDRRPRRGDEEMVGR